MPLLTEGKAWDRTRLLELLRSQSEGIDEILERVRAAESGWREPMSRLTAIDLLTDVRSLSQGTLATPAASDAVLRQVANVQYDTILAGIDLLKSHSDVPKVPRPSH